MCSPRQLRRSAAQLFRAALGVFGILFELKKKQFQLSPLRGQGPHGRDGSLMLGGAAEGTEEVPRERLQYLEFPVDDFFRC